MEVLPRFYLRETTIERALFVTSEGKFLLSEAILQTVIYSQLEIRGFKLNKPITRKDFFNGTLFSQYKGDEPDESRNKVQ